MLSALTRPLQPALPHCHRAMADAAQPSDDADASKAAPQAGELLFCGSTAWETIGRKQANDGSTSLPAPHRLRVLQGVPIVFIAGGAGASLALSRAPAFAIFVFF